MMSICFAANRKSLRLNVSSAGEHGIGFYQGRGGNDHPFPPYKSPLNFAGRLAVMFMP
jgi:hypothetical protein